MERSTQDWMNVDSWMDTKKPVVDGWTINRYSSASAPRCADHSEEYCAVQFLMNSLRNIGTNCGFKIWGNFGTQQCAGISSHLHISCNSKVREWWLYGWMLFLNDLKLSMEKSNLGIIVLLQMDAFFVIPKISIFSYGLRVGGWVM